MTMVIRRNIAQITGVVLLSLWSTGLTCAKEPSSPRTRFLSSDGTPLNKHWHAAPGATVFVLIHGFRSRGTDDAFLRQAAAAQQRFTRAQVVIVDWEVPTPRKASDNTGGNSEWAGLGLFKGIRALPGEYRSAVAASRQVGHDIASWLAGRQIHPAQVVLCGHSLGAQIAGFVGHDLADKSGEPPMAILAADPAGPLFAGQEPGARLDRTDARQVIVIHTTDLLGDPTALGTVDIFVTWPEAQRSDPIARHSHAIALVTESFLQPDMTSTEGCPFGANMLQINGEPLRPQTSRLTFAATIAQSVTPEDVQLQKFEPLSDL